MNPPWRLLLQPGLPGVTQMAIDESLFQSCAGSSPILRFYSWREPTLSLGRFQDYKKVVSEPFCVHNNISVVRRLTGGRAVLHHREVTYAVVAPLDRGFFQDNSLQQTYSRIAEALNLALKMMGVERSLIALDPETPPVHPRTGAGQCFVSVSRFEIADHLRKIIGSAQKRAGNRFLQHGSILLDFDSRLQAGCVLDPDPGIESKIAPLNGLLGRDLQFTEVSGVFASAFQAALNIQLVADDLSSKERGLAVELETVYSGDNWTRNGCR